LVEATKNSFVVPNFVAVKKQHFFRVPLLSKNRNTGFKEFLNQRIVCENETGIERILIIFQDRLMFNYMIQKVSARAFH